MTAAIVGAGAIGGLIAGHLARSGQETIVIARGPHLAAMQSHGLTVRSAEGEFTTHPEATDDIGAVRRADVVFVTLKAHSITAVAPALGAALDPSATVVAAVNGIPWWYVVDGPLQSVDPGGVINRSIPRAQVVGCVVYPAATVARPGVIEHAEGNRFSLGEPDGGASARVQGISAMLSQAGFKAPVQSRLRSEIWHKLLGNATLNPVSALTRESLGRLLADATGRELVRTLMEEVAAVARSLEVELPFGIDKRIKDAAAVGEHKTSMLQDLEAGRPLEIDALLGAVIELAGTRSVSVPSLRVLYDLT
ncbi:MAG TPA: 2-dehydropantoate 2-reductase, partial [Patescibacteria group bacterium]|nr:2-dehydropantoate 2-reductase [Patescibacteria group bacterium]